MAGPQHLIAPPEQIAALRRNQAGFPIPFFVANQHHPDPEFWLASPVAYRKAVMASSCWVCGRRRPGGADAFVIGPMCAVNRISADPPAHPECVDYAVKVCPFLSRPEMKRHSQDLPPGTTMPGIPILRNPGVAGIWVCAEWQLTKIPGQGWLFDLGEPISVSWWSRGRPATRAEVLASMTSGLPLLEEQCANDPDPDQSRIDLARDVEMALTLIPAE